MEPAASEAQKGAGVGEPVAAAQVLHASSAVAQEIPTGLSSSSSSVAGPETMQAVLSTAIQPKIAARTRERRYML